MKHTEYERSIATGEVQLSLRQKVFYYRIAILLLSSAILLSIINLLKYFNGQPRLFLINDIYIIAGVFIFALLFFWLQKNRLKFKKLKTTLKKEEIIDLLTQLCKEWEWKPYWHKENIFLAKTDKSFSKKAGELVVVLIAGDDVLINSINDPEKRFAFGSWKKNKKNTQAVITMLERADLIYHNK